MRIIFFLILVLFGLEASAQLGIGLPRPDISSMLDVSSSNKGVLIPRVQLISDTQTLALDANVVNAHSLLVFNMGSSSMPEGFYYWHANSLTENTIGNGKWIKVGATESAAPKFFYMPSVLLPTSTNDTRVVANDPNFVLSSSTSDSGTGVTLTFTINLYNIFKSQFETPIASSLPGGAGIGDKLNEFVLSKDKYHYFVTYADQSVLKNISVDANGLLIYKVQSNAIIRNGTFMNIVLKVR